MQDSRRDDPDALGLFSESGSETRRSNRRRLRNNRFNSRSRKDHTERKELNRYDDEDYLDS